MRRLMLIAVVLGLMSGCAISAQAGVFGNRFGYHSNHFGGYGYRSFYGYGYGGYGRSYYAPVVVAPPLVIQQPPPPVVVQQQPAIVQQPAALPDYQQAAQPDPLQELVQKLLAEGKTVEISIGQDGRPVVRVAPSPKQPASKNGKEPSDDNPPPPPKGKPDGKEPAGEPLDEPPPKK